ncbi:hypothetical protein JCM8208_007708 [Rhodotorula glutinis]
MARRQAVERHDDFLSESDLSPSSGEDDRGAVRAPYNAVRDRAPSSGSALRRPYRDEDELATCSSDGAAASARRSAAPPVLGSSEDESTDEDEEKLIGGGKERTAAKKGKKEKRRWEMRSGAGAAGTAPPSGGSNTGVIVGAIVVFVVVVCGVGFWYAYKQGMFGDSSDSATTSGTSVVAGRTTGAATGGAAGATGAEDAVTTAGTTAHTSGTAAASASSGSMSGSASGSASASGASASSAASDSPEDVKYTLETVTTTDDDGATQTLTGFESLATDGGSTVTTFIETDAVPSGGAKGDKHSGDDMGSSSSVRDAVEGVVSAIKSAGASGGGGGDDADEGMPRLDSETLVTTIDGKETTVRGLWKTELVGGSDPTSSFVVMHVGGDRRRRNSLWPAQTAPPARLL